MRGRRQRGNFSTLPAAAQSSSVKNFWEFWKPEEKILHRKPVNKNLVW